MTLLGYDALDETGTVDDSPLRPRYVDFYFTWIELTFVKGLDENGIPKSGH